MPNDVVDGLSRLCLCRAGCSQRRRRFLDEPDHGLWCGPAHASLRARLGLGLRFGGEELHVKFIESSECVHCGPDVHPGCTGSDCARSQVANGRPAVVGGSDRGHFEDIFWKKTCLLLLHHLRSGTTHRCRTSSVRPFLASTTARVAVNRAGGSGCICPRL